MSKALVATDGKSIAAMGNALVSANAYPGLSEANSGQPRTILIGRMLAGASESDLLMGTLLCLPRSETFGLAIFGEPAGPTFKTHPEQMKARFDPEDPGAVGLFIDWRLSLSNTTVVASFDHSCAAAMVETVELLTTTFELPIDVIFLAARDEGSPGLLKRLQSSSGRVIIARQPAVSSRFDETGDLKVPPLPKILAEDYASAQTPLRELVAALPAGSRAMFLSNLLSFSRALEGMLDE